MNNLWERCPNCCGTGKVGNSTCPSCDGKGIINKMTGLPPSKDDYTVTYGSSTMPLTGLTYINCDSTTPHNPRRFENTVTYSANEIIDKFFSNGSK